MNDQIDLGPLERAPVDATHRLAKFGRLIAGRRSLLPLVIVLLAVIAGIALTNGGSLSSTPIDYYEDSLFQYGVASSANEAGLTATHPRLNYPFGADWRDFAIHTDTASVAQYWVISFFSDSPIQIVNVAYVLSYLFCAVAFYLVARSFKIHEAIAAGLAIGYAFLPYHFFRGIHHQFMSQYWTLPVLVWLASWPRSSSTGSWCGWPPRSPGVPTLATVRAKASSSPPVSFAPSTAPITRSSASCCWVSR